MLESFRRRTKHLREGWEYIEPDLSSATLRFFTPMGNEESSGLQNDTPDFLSCGIARLLPRYSYSLGTAQIMTKGDLEVFLYWWISPGGTITKSPFFILVSLSSLTTTPLPSMM